MIGEAAFDGERGPRLDFAVGGAFVVALLLAVISIGGLVIPALYAREAPSWAIQAVAQDWFDLVITAPLLLAAAVWAAIGSHRGRVVLAGLLLFAVYTLAVYAFAVHLNALFLVYCAALGLSVFALIALTWALLHEPGTPCGRSPRRIAGAYLIATGVIFGALWLAQLVPAAITGQVPAELAEAGLVTNPIHVIDLSVILPLQVIGGVLLLRGRPAGFVLAPILLTFDAVMSASIGVLLVYADGPLPIAIAMAAISIGALALLAPVLRAGNARTAGAAQNLPASSRRP